MPTNVCTLNLCLGLKNKKLLVKRLLVENKIDVLCMQETEIMKDIDQNVIKKLFTEHPIFYSNWEQGTFGIFGHWSPPDQMTTLSNKIWRAATIKHQLVLLPQLSLP